MFLSFRSYIASENTAYRSQNTIDIEAVLLYVSTAMGTCAEIREEVVYHGLGTCPLGRVSARGHLRTSYGLATFRTLKTYALVYVLSGKGFYEDRNSGRRDIRAGDLIIVFPGMPHKYGPTDVQGWSEIYLLFEGPAFDMWCRQGILQPGKPVLHVHPIEQWSRQFAEILQDSDSSASPNICLRTVCRVQSLLASILSWREASSHFDDDAAWLDRAAVLLQSPTYRGLSAVAQQTGSSLDSFRKRFRRLAGVSPTSYRTARLIDRACVLIQEGRLRDVQIADLLGFYDAAHFSKRFKEVTGITPSAFRAQLPDVGERDA